MARTGPQKIPGASQAYFYGTGQFSGTDMEVNCGVVHTTESRTLPTYADSQGRHGAMAPTVTGLPDIKNRKIRWYQHFDVDESARALANKLGGVETNTLNAFQVELVGTCDDRYATTWAGKKAGVDYIHWPTAPEWALAEVAWLVRWLHDHHGIPLTCVKDWLAYGKDPRRPGITPASYGANPARMSFAQWRSFKGWCGHQHVPENDHGDPGSMDFARVIQLAKNSGKPTEPSPPPTTSSGTYTVKSGDTLSSIGQRLGVPWPDIAKANNISSPYRIYPGDELRIPKAAKPVPQKPVVSLSRLIAAARQDPPKAGTPVSYSGTKVVEDALVREGLLAKGLADGHFGTATVSAYSAWQRRLGYRGRDADGIPGRDSLTRLGRKYGFDVKD